jgi:hypothetical protein
MPPEQEIHLKNNYVLIDYENVRVSSLALLKAECFRVWVFLGPKNTKLDTPLVLSMQEFGDRAVYIPLKLGGPNALDFHIAYHLGALANADPTGLFHIISEDKGFDPLIHHLKTKKISVARSTSIEAMPCFRPKQKEGDSGAKLTAEELLNAVIVDLVKRKTAKPRTSKKLLSTIQARCGTDVPASKIEAIYETLVNKGYVKIDGVKVAYSLPLIPDSKPLGPAGTEPDPTRQSGFRSPAK